MTDWNRSESIPVPPLSLSLDLVEKGIKCTRTGYNHIDSVVECALAINIGYVFLQLRYMHVGGKLVPLGGGPCGIRGRLLMSRFCSSIPQHLGPVVWAPRSLVTSKTRVSLVARRVTLKMLIAMVALRSLVTTRTPQGGRRIDSWQLVTVLRTEAGLPHCLFPLDPPHLLLLCPNHWAVIDPERHSSPDVGGFK